MGDLYTGYDQSGLDPFGNSAPPFPEGGELAPVESRPEPHVVAERIPVSDSTDDLTRATIRKMCDYIRESITDPFVEQCAKLAFFRFGQGRSPVGVFWFLKHKLRRVLDEGTGLGIGEANAADILISPRVLLRQVNPQGDCDDFTMAACALVGCMNVETCIVTVACDPREPDRWSHVFMMVKAPDGEWFPLDCSHGPQPGWMVPQERISRWQAWDLNANPIDAKPPVRSQLGQFVNVVRRRRPVRPRGRGFGQIVICPDGSVSDDQGNCGGAGLSTETLAGLESQPSPTLTTTTPSTPSTLSTINWSSIISQGLTDATKVASIAELPYGASLNANGTVTGLYGQPAALFQSLMPILLIAGGVLIFASVMGGHR